MQKDLFSILINKLKSDEPLATDASTASVAIIISSKFSPKILLIKRAVNHNDPWSGQIALPGGKAEATDISARQTAIREAFEEVGIDLIASSDFLGYLPVFQTHTGNMDVMPAVFLLKAPAPVKLNREASAFYWVDPANLFFEDTNVKTYTGEIKKMHAFIAYGNVIWGLTYRILSFLLSDDRGCSENSIFSKRGRDC